MTFRCRDCRDGFDHCHGAVLHHLRYRAECTDECATPDAPHAFHIDCDALGCACVGTVAGVAI